MAKSARKTGRKIVPIFAFLRAPNVSPSASAAALCASASSESDGAGNAISRAHSPTGSTSALDVRRQRTLALFRLVPTPDHAIGYAMHSSRSRDAVILAFMMRLAT